MWNIKFVFLRLADIQSDKAQLTKKFPVVRFQVLTETNLKMDVFWDVEQCSMVDIFPDFSQELTSSIIRAIVLQEIPRLLLNHKVIYVFTKASRRTLYWSRWIKSTLFNLFPVKSIFILASHLRLHNVPLSVAKPRPQKGRTTLRNKCQWQGRTTLPRQFHPAAPCFKFFSLSVQWENLFLVDPFWDIKAEERQQEKVA